MFLSPTNSALKRVIDKTQEQELTPILTFYVMQHQNNRTFLP